MKIMLSSQKKKSLLRTSVDGNPSISLVEPLPSLGRQIPRHLHRCSHKITPARNKWTPSKILEAKGC
jgi:hypothetical protein